MIYYFSATGNSQHVATRIAEAIGTQAQSIETASSEIVLTDNEPLGFVTPTNWNELPVLVREFIRKAEIRLAKDNYVFAVATYGFLQGFVCEDARRELKRKGIEFTVRRVIREMTGAAVNTFNQPYDIFVDENGNIDRAILDSLMPWSKTLPTDCYSKRRS